MAAVDDAAVGEVGTDDLIKIVVKSPKDKKDIIIAKTADVKQLKDIITKEFSAESEQLCLIYAGKILKDTDRLSIYGIKDGTTIHLVIKSANKAQDGTGSENQQGSSVTGAPINIGATPFGLGSLGGLLGLANFGFGSANFMDLQQQMQREVFSNPNLLRNLLENPMVRQLLSNPALLQSLLSFNPQMRELMQENPEISRVVENPELMQQASEVARHPAMLQEMMRNSTDGISADNIPSAFRNIGEQMSIAASESSSESSGQTENQLSGNVGSGGSSIGTTNAGVESVIQQMIQNPQLMANIIQGPYMQSMLQNLASNPDIIRQFLGGTPLVPGNAETQQSVSNALPFLAQQLANPEVQSLVGNPRALQAMLDIQQGMQQLHQEAPNYVLAGGGGVSGSTRPSSDTPALNNGTVADGTSPAAGNDQYSELLRRMFGVMSRAADSSDLSPEVRYEHQLNQLSMMGFSDRQANIIALTSTSGDVNSAIDFLLRQT